MSNVRVVLLAAVCAGLLLLSAAPVTAQLGNTGTVVGKVTDENGQPAEGAEIVVKGLDTGRECRTKTDKRGEYLCSGMLAGRYEISFKYKSFTGKRPEVRIQGGLYGDPTKGEFRNRYDFQLGGSAQAAEQAKKQQEEEFEKLKSGYERATAYNQAGKYAEALAELAPVVEKDPTQWVVHYQMAVAYTGLKRFDEALAAYQKAIELNPTEPALYTNVGQLYVKMNRLDDARKQFELAAQVSPESAGTNYFNIGVLLYNNNDLKAAIEPLRKATELDPTRADAFYLLGMCLYNSAEYKTEGGEVKTILLPGTRESFERYLELAPDGKFANDAKAMLAAIDATVPAAVRVRKK